MPLRVWSSTDKATKTGLTPVYMTSRIGHTRVIGSAGWSKQEQGDADSLSIASQKGHQEVVRYVFEVGDESRKAMPDALLCEAAQCIVVREQFYGHSLRLYEEKV
eukprot:gnl/TRDRNA2_/TRDRNA2_155402_c0_seq4.p2 gnl/TRDRNA2_/TRDRNA2_155402_c0~~gnl/TRDRNA2_/TRDRNA2_155402_c0_seq4.p2  ORF type:complete len:105 (+),score=16.15 gnl/TRDRNA2_/TRDRNA2_155402_c0_seq4:111-425(+)